PATEEDRRPHPRPGRAGKGQSPRQRMRNPIRDRAAHQRPKCAGEDRRVSVRTICAPARTSTDDDGNHSPDHGPDNVAHGALHYAKSIRSAGFSFDSWPSPEVTPTAYHGGSETGRSHRAYFV